MIPLIQIIHTVLLAILPFSPFPEFLIFPYLSSNGLLPYSQVIDQHMPGLLMLPFNLSTLGFTSSKSLHILYVLVILFQSVLLSRISKNVFAVLFFALLQFAFRAMGLWYETFLPLFTLPALYFFLTKNYFWTGLFVGLAVLFKQHGALLLVPLLFTAPKRFGHVFLGFIAPVTALTLYLLKINSFSDFIYWTGTFNLHIYAPMANQLPTLKSTILLAICTLVGTTIYFSSRNHLIKLSYHFFLFSLPGIFIRFTPLQLHAALPFLAIVLAAGSQKQKIITLLSLLLFLFPLPIQHNYLTPDIQLVATHISHFTRPQDEIFLLGAQPHLYVLSQTLPASRYFSYHLPWYLRVNQATQLEALHRNPPRLIVIDTASQIDGISIFDSAKDLFYFAQANYRLVESVGSHDLYVKAD